MTLEFSLDFFKNTQMCNFMKNLLVGAGLFHADRQTDRHDKVKSLFSQYCERA